MTAKRLLRVSNTTECSKLCGAIQHVYEENPSIELTLRMIGAGPINQAVKAIILCNKWAVRKGIQVSLIPTYTDIDNPKEGAINSTITAIEFLLEFKKV